MGCENARTSWSAALQTASKDSFAKGNRKANVYEPVPQVCVLISATTESVVPKHQALTLHTWYGAYIEREPYTTVVLKYQV